MLMYNPCDKYIFTFVLHNGTWDEGRRADKESQSEYKERESDRLALPVVIFSNTFITISFTLTNDSQSESCKGAYVMR